MNTQSFFIVLVLPKRNINIVRKQTQTSDPLLVASEEATV